MTMKEVITQLRARMIQNAVDCDNLLFAREPLTNAALLSLKEILEGTGIITGSHIPWNRNDLTCLNVGGLIILELKRTRVKSGHREYLLPSNPVVARGEEYLPLTVEHFRDMQDLQAAANEARADKALEARGTQLSMDQALYAEMVARLGGSAEADTFIRLRRKLKLSMY